LLLSAKLKKSSSRNDPILPEASFSEQKKPLRGKIFRNFSAEKYVRCTFVENKRSKMVESKVIKRIEKLRKSIASDGISPEALATELKEIREEVKSLDKYPLVVRALRLVYEYIEQSGTFDIQFLEDSADPVENLDYYLQLLEHPENPYNQEELLELTEALKQV